MNEEEISRSAVKRQYQASKELIKALMQCTDAQLSAMPMPENLIDAIIEAKKLNKGALNRQIRYANGMLAKIDVEAVERSVQQAKEPHRQEVAIFHKVERLREQLITGDEALMEELISEQNLERSQLRQLIRNSRSQTERTRKKAERQLFRYLHDSLEQ